VYGTGGYMNQFLDILYDEELMDYIVVKGVTDDVKTEMERHDAVVDFSKNHSFGMPYIEGILNGKMVYCMKNTGSAEVLSEFPECYIQSYDDLVEKMRRLPEIPLEQLQKYYDVISEKYSRETVGKKFIDYLNR
jgi:glycosyltransferase involved in cell wall biosynthesis